MKPLVSLNDQVTKDQLKRKRVQFSCVACKQRKVKCDRGRPHCNVCIARNTTDKCFYPSSAPKNSSVNIFHVTKQIGYNLEEEPRFVPGSNEHQKQMVDDHRFSPMIDTTSSSEPEFHMMNNHDKKSSVSTTDGYLISPKYNNAYANNSTSVNDTTTNIQSAQTKSDLVSEILMIKEQLRNLENSIDNKMQSTSPRSLEALSRQQQIKERIANLLHYLKISMNEKFDIYNDYKPMFYFVSRINGYGPLAWIALVMKDPFSQPVLENILYEKFNNLKVSEIFYNQYIASPDIDDDLGNTDAEKRKLNYKEYIDSNILPPRKQAVENLTYRDLINVLPKKKVIWLLIDRFYKYVYPFAPYADQNVCAKQMSKILNTNRANDYTSEDHITFIDIKNKLDLAYVGCILIMLKLSYKTLITINDGEDSDSIKTEEEIYLKNNPLSDRMIEISRYILDNFDFTKRCTFPVYQCALFLRFYQKIDGEKFYSQGDTHISNSILVQMASSLGMNRDPSKFVKPFSFSLCGSLGRKIWHSLVSIDNFQYFQEGIPKSIVESFCDTELPQFDAALSNNNDLNIEKLTIKLIHTRHDIESSMKPIADAICNIDKPPTVADVMDLLENFEYKLHSRFGLFCELLKRPHDGTYYARLDKVSDAMVLLEGVSLVFTVVLHLGLKFESMKQYASSKFFSNKILASMMRFINVIPDIALSCHKYFGPGFDFIIVPALEVILCKSMVFITSNYVKYSVFKKKLLMSETLDMERLPLIEQILHSFLYDIFYDKHLRVLKALSPNFFFAWRILKVQLYIFHLLKDEKLSYEKQANVFTFVEFSTPDDLMKTIQLIDVNNYNTPPSDTCCYFSAIYEQYKENMCDEDPKTTVLYTGLNPELQQMKRQLYCNANMQNKNGNGYLKKKNSIFDNEKCDDQILSTIFSVEDDKFWMEMFENSKQSNQQNDIFRILDSLDSSQKNGNFQTDLIFPVPDMNEVTEGISTNSAHLPTSGGHDKESNPPSNKFVDEAIFDLLF